MFCCDKLRVFHLTRHMSLLNAINSLNIDEIVTKLSQIDATLKRIGIEHPRIALAALNPHASDHGMFGDEERLFLEPAAAICQKTGMNVTGPVPADSVFYQALNDRFDGVLSLYHDQGHIACKTYNYQKSVSATLGYAFMRTTVDHGTAYDIAGKGIADCENLYEAIRVGTVYWKLQNNRNTQ